MDIEKEKFKKAKEEAEIFYKSINKVYCPYLKDKINFNTKGLDHIKFKEWKKPRVRVDQYVRLRLLKLIPEVLKNSYTLQEYYETKRFERIKINSRWEERMREVFYWGFVAVIKGSRIKVIVKQFEGGEKYFWSIIPFWKNYRVGEVNKKSLHEGDLEIQ